MVGVGHIGSAVVRRLHGFGCRVLTCSNTRTADATVEFVSLDHLLTESDVVTLHVPLNAGTHHLIGRAQLATMKPGAVLVNTGRGALVDTHALIAALEDGSLRCAALDVLEEGTHSSKLHQLPNAIVTPHTAYYTTRALRDTVETTLVNCLNFERTSAHGATHDRDLVRGLLGGA